MRWRLLPRMFCQARGSLPAAVPTRLLPRFLRFWLQEAMRKVVKGVGGFDHAQVRSRHAGGLRCAHTALAAPLPATLHGPAEPLPGHPAPL